MTETTDGTVGDDGDRAASQRAEPGETGPMTDDQFLGMVEQFYRAEVERMTTWRTRLDQTTNWAVVVMAAILTWAFSSPENPHYVLLIGALTVVVFLGVEAQRYQEYDAWRTRIRLLQKNLFAEGYRAEGVEFEEWRGWMSEDLRAPELHLSFAEAVGHRLQHVYLPLLTVLLAAWGLRISVFVPSTPWEQTASVADVPGPVVAAGVLCCYLALVGVAVWSARQGVRREFDYAADPESAPDGRR